MQTPSDYLAKIGSRGGSAKSPAKMAAMNRNLKMAWAGRREKCAKKRAEKALNVKLSSSIKPA